MTGVLAPSRGTRLTAAFFQVARSILKFITTTSESQRARVSCARTKGTGRRCAVSSGAPTGSSWRVAVTITYSAYGISILGWGEGSSEIIKWARSCRNRGSPSLIIKRRWKHSHGARGRDIYWRPGVDREIKRSSSGILTLGSWFHRYKLNLKFALFNGILMIRKFSHLMVSSTINFVFGNIPRWRKSLI